MSACRCVLASLGLWVAFRLVNMPAFADFLIAVEAEMNKVSWPTRGELFRSFDGGACFASSSWRSCCIGYDLFWSSLLHLLRIVGT